MTPRFINAFQQTRFHRPYATALRFDVNPRNRQQIDEGLVLRIRRKREYLPGMKRYRRVAGKEQASLRNAIRVHRIPNHQAVLVKILVRKFLLV